MRGDPCAYEAHYPVGFWKPGPVIKTALLTATVVSISPGWDRLIGTGILWAFLLLWGAGLARFGRTVALRISSAGVTMRKEQLEKKRIGRRMGWTTTTVPWNHVGYLVIWHDGRDTSLSVQPPGGPAQWMRLDWTIPANYLTVRARALDEQRLVSAVARYGPAVQVMDGDTGFPVAESPRART
jgi:hypothetical protein